MAQPIWITPAGNLGTYPEGVFFQLPLLAEDPGSGQLFYEVIAGRLPSGVQCEANGLIVGVPKAIVSLQGVPQPVSEDVTSKFAARVYTKKPNGQIDRLADRTFTITISGQDVPEFITPAGQIAQYYDGSALVPGYQILYTDTDPADLVVVKLIGGSLPPGLSVSSSGLISGVVEPVSDVGALAGFSRDGQGYAQYPFDFSTRSTNQNYEFTLEVTDGKGSNIRTFSILVWAKNTMTADNTILTADNTFVTADVTNQRQPILTNLQGSIGNFRTDNWFAYRFDGYDFDGGAVVYEILWADSVAIPGLTLDLNSGWLYGYIPDLGISELTYDFVIRVAKYTDTSIYNDYNFSLTLIGAVSSEIIWLTASNLGTIDNGSTSMLYVQAVSASGLALQYQLVSGSTSSLPQGLELLPSGLIAGRVSFDTFALDLGSTTFDVSNNDLALLGQDTTTTFDMTYSFVVNVFSTNGVVNVNKTFTITVVRAYNEPYENLYIQAMPPQTDRDLVDSLLQNQDIFRNNLLYRPDDPNFGKATKVVYWHAYGLRASTVEDYVAGLYINHYLKNLVLGSIKVAQARVNGTGPIIYEAVYSTVIDDLVNAQGQSVSKAVTLPYPVTMEDSTQETTVYPNSLINMRDQVIDQVGQISNILPIWMLSKQANGRVLGFTPAWVLAYAKPGRGDQLAYYIRKQFGERLNLIDFEVDRYELDRLLSKNWDPIADSTQGAWEPPPAATTFDIQAHYQLPEPNDSSFVFTGGTGYAVGDQIAIYGPQLDAQTNQWIWDPAYLGPYISITNQRLTATAEVIVSGRPSTLGTYAIQTGDTVMFSVTLVSSSGVSNSTSVGVGNHSMPLGNFAGSDGSSLGFNNGGQVWGNGTQLASGLNTFTAAGAVIDVAIDRINNLAYVRVNGQYWNNNPAADPAQATGGIDIAYLPGTIYPVVSPWRSFVGFSDQITVNTQAQYAVPEGFQFVGGLTNHSNDVLITVNTVSVTGNIEDAFCRGTAPLLSVGETFVNIVGTNLTGTGTGATWDFEVVGENETTFDGNSLKFIAPVDMYSNTTTYDKYLKFPHRTILG
jgi:hypothetical protein